MEVLFKIKRGLRQSKKKATSREETFVSWKETQKTFANGKFCRNKFSPVLAKTQKFLPMKVSKENYFYSFAREIKFPSINITRR